MLFNRQRKICVFSDAAVGLTAGSRLILNGLTLGIQVYTSYLHWALNFANITSVGLFAS